MLLKVSPSILSCDFANLQSSIEFLSHAGADMIHIDVMDGRFVPNITIGPCVVKSMRQHTKLPFDVHLMIDSPSKYIEDFVKAGADIITVHPESDCHLDKLMNYIKSFGVKMGVALNPSTNENILEYILHNVDLVLIMTVNPGFASQGFLHSQLSKIAKVREMINKIGKNIMLEVDGGINLETAKLVKKAGADVLVSGSYIFQTHDTKEIAVRIKNLQLLNN